MATEHWDFYGYGALLRLTPAVISKQGQGRCLKSRFLRPEAARGLLPAPYSLLLEHLEVQRLLEHAVHGADAGQGTLQG
jgi:hypothetical protein